MKNTRETRIKAQEIIEEFKQTIKENYVVLIEENPQDTSSIILRYLNGQRFLLSVREIEP